MRNNVSDDAMFVTFMTGCFVVGLLCLVGSVVGIVLQLVGVI